MDDIVEDARREVEVMLAAWQSQGTRGGIFRPQGDGIASSASSVYFNETNSAEDRNLLRVVVGDLGQEIQRDAAERERERHARLSGSSNTRSSGEYSTVDEDSYLLWGVDS